MGGNDSGTVNQPQFNKAIEHQAPPRYTNPKTIGEIQDDLRESIPPKQSK